MSEVRDQISEKSIRTGMADRVRAACRKLSCKKFVKNGWFTRRDIYFEVDPNAGQEYRSFERTWQDLIYRGELQKICAITKAYKYLGAAAPSSDVREKIYRAIHIKGAFCVADIKRLTDGDQSYISAVIRRLVKAGDLELTGKVGKVKMFRVKDSNAFYLKFVNRKKGTANGRK